MIQGVVSATVSLLKGMNPPSVGNGGGTQWTFYRNGVYDTVTAILIRPGVQEKALFDKVKRAFEPVHKDWIHTKLAEERIVEAILA
jgi:hypothetical protein